MGKPFWRSVEYFFTGNYSADDDDNNIVAIGFGGQIHAYGGNDHITLGSIGASVYTGTGNDTVVGGAAYLKVNDSSGDLTVKGAAGYAEIYKEGDGDIAFAGAAGGAVIQHDGNTGNLSYSGAAAYNNLSRRGNLGDMTFTGAGGYNNLYSDVAHGNINFTGAGGYNQITRKGGNDDFSGEGIAYANAEEIVLTKATMGGSWIQNSQKVVGVKSTREANTYLFAFADEKYTKVNKVLLHNDPETGKLKYYTTSWYKSGNLLDKLAALDVSDYGGFQVVDVDGAYTLSDLTVEQHQVVTIHAIEKELPEDQWVTYAGGVQIAADSIILSNAKMGGYAVARDGSTVDVKPVKSLRMKNTYLYAKVLDGYTKVVMVQLKNDSETGALKYIAQPWYKEGDHTAEVANQFVGPNYGYKALGKGSYTLSDVNYSVKTVRVSTGHVTEMHGFTEQELFKSAIDSNNHSSGDVHYEGAGGGNVIKSNVHHGNVIFKGAGIANVILHNSETGNTEFDGAGAANVIFKKGKKGNLTFNGAGIANVITHISSVPQKTPASQFSQIAQSTNDGMTNVMALGGANILTRKGAGKVSAVMGGGSNVLTHIGDGYSTGMMLGGANVITKIGHGSTTGIMFGIGNILSHIGNGQTLGIMGAAGNVFTKVGDGEAIAAMLGLGNLFTHVGQGDDYTIMAGGANVFTKVGDGKALALMVALGNVFTHIGEGMAVALMLAKGNIATKVGNGEMLAAMVGEANVMTHIGNGSSFAAMLGGANVMTKVGDGLTIGLMIGKANIYTQVGNSTTIGLLAGNANIMTKVGDETTLAAMFGQANIMTHVGDGLTGTLALGKANIVTKVGQGFMGVVTSAEANVVTHVGNGTTAGLLHGKGNILTKVGDGTTVGLLVSQIGNIMTHVGNGNTVGFAKGKANIVTKVGDEVATHVAWGDANVMTHVGKGSHYSFAQGKANIVTKVGDGQTATVLNGQANMVTRVGDGDDYTGAWGKANVITKVGNGRNVALAKGDANIVTQIGTGDSFNALWSQGNAVTKVGNGTQITTAKGKGNITTTVGDGLNVTVAHGDLNVNTKWGDGISVNAVWGKFNINTKVGDGLNISAMKGSANANVHVGDGINIHASYARNNLSLQVGNGDFYSFAVASSNTQSNKLEALFGHVKQTLLGVAGSQGINYLINGDEANTSGSYRGRGAINLPEVSSLNGFKMTEVDEITSELQADLKGTVTHIDSPDIGKIQQMANDEGSSSASQPNLITNGDFEQGSTGWLSTQGTETQHPAASYGLDNDGHGSHVSELDANANTTIYQDIQNLADGETITLDFDFARRAGSNDDNGMDVLWNGKIVFSSQADPIKWQHKQLTLIAQAGSNRLEFKGTGISDGRGYLLDNVVAHSEHTEPANADYAGKDPLSAGVMKDKASAEADQQRLIKEREKQLAAISATQRQLEETDIRALDSNGLSQRDAIKAEEQAVTADFVAKADLLANLDNVALDNVKNTINQKGSGDPWRHAFAGGLLDGLQTQLERTKSVAGQQLDDALSTLQQQQKQLKTAVKKSEAGVANGEQHRLNAQQDIEDARAKAEFREQEARSQQKRAQQAEHDGYAALKQAEMDAGRMARDSSHESNHNNRAGSGLSGKAYESTGAGKTESHLHAGNPVQGDGRFSQEIQGLDEDFSELLDAKQAIQRLQINAGIRAKHAAPPLTQDKSSQPRISSREITAPVQPVQPQHESTPMVSGLDLSGLEALGPNNRGSQRSNGSAGSLTYSFINERVQKVANVYRWLNSENYRLTDLSPDIDTPIPGIKRTDVEIHDNVRQQMVDFIENYLNNTENQIPPNRVAALAKLFVDSTLDYDWDKRARFLFRLEQYGYSFEPVHGDQSIVSFWSGSNFKQYRDILDAAQPDGKKVVYDIDIKGNRFALELNKQLMRWGSLSLDPDDVQQKTLQSAIKTSALSNIGFWSSVYATGSRGDVYVIAEGGLRLGNFFWNVELPVLRQLQREGLINEIRLLDKPAHEYRNVPLESIGKRLADAGVKAKIRFDAMSEAEQKKYLEMDPHGYQPTTLVDLNIKLSAIDGMLNKAIPFYRLRSERNILVQEGIGGLEVHQWSENRNYNFKTIKMENTKDPAQIKTIEHFIFANYSHYDQLPKELHLIENRIVSHDKGRTRILAEKIDGGWRYRPNAELMSLSELQRHAYVRGKPLGESYQNILRGMRAYEQSLLEDRDYSLDAIEKLTVLHQQVEGYLLGHPESGRSSALKLLLSQINTRLEESLILAEPTLRSSGKGSFSELYSKLDNANLKDSKHLYIDADGDFVTRGKFSVQIGKDTAGVGLEQVMAAIRREYGQEVTNAVFSQLTPYDLAKDGKGIDVAGLKKVHRAIEQHLSPVSATLYIWKPSETSTIGHSALQIGQGRVLLGAADVADFNDMNYVSWWPAGGKSIEMREIFNISTEEFPDLRLRWRDFSQPAHQNPALRFDVAAEEDDDFGLSDGSYKLKEFLEKLKMAKGVSATFKDVSEGFAIAALANPILLETTGIPEYIYRPFLAQWADPGMDMNEVGQRFAEVLRMAAQMQSPKRVEKLIENVTRQFAERELSDINDFKNSKIVPGRVYRINLEGLDVGAMQAEWHKISSDPDARYQLLTKNCSSVVARILQAGGADKVLGNKWRPFFGVWTPNELFQFGEALQKATQLNKIKEKWQRLNGEESDAILEHAFERHEEMLEKVAIPNDDAPPRESAPLEPLTRFMNNQLYGVKEDRRRISKFIQIQLGRDMDRQITEKVTLQGEIGRLDGYYHLGSSRLRNHSANESANRKVVLFIHGSGSSAEEQAFKIKDHYQSQGIDVLAVNMRGYGNSDGRPSELGLYQDARTMFRYLVNDRGISPDNIVIHGYSMGAPIAADLARYAERRGQAVAGLLLDRPMPSMAKAIAAHGIPNPTGLTGALAKTVNGQFSVEKNLQGLSIQTSIMLLTDNEGLGEEGEKLRTKLIEAGYDISGEHTYHSHDASNPLMEQYAKKIVSNLFEGNFRTRHSVVLKGIKNDLRRYAVALQPTVDDLGRQQDIRATKAFLSGYKYGHAERIIDGFHPDMNIKQLVDMLVKKGWTAEQKGALAWEIENRALKITLQPKTEKYNRLFRDVTSAGMADPKASEHLAPQLLLLNLSNDGFGGRCVPLSKFVLVAKQLENEGREGVANALLSKLYSAASVLSHPELYSENEQTNASKLLGTLSALYARNPMFDSSIKVWKEKLAGEQALTVKGVIEKITATNVEGASILLELNTLGHAMAAWSKGSGENRMYGFYDPNVGIVEFSSAEKFGNYMTRFFGRSDLNMATNYKMAKNGDRERIFDRVIVLDGSAMASYRPVLGDRTTMKDILDMDIFDGTPMKNALGAERPLDNLNVSEWERVAVTELSAREESTSEASAGGKSSERDSRFDGQVIIQTENDLVAARAAANLAGKHPDSSVIVQLDANGQYQVVYGEPTKLAGKIRWQVVGHGRDAAEHSDIQGHTRMSGYSAAELAMRLKQFSNSFPSSGQLQHISLVGCSLISNDKRDGFARHLISALDGYGIRASVSARSSDVAVDNRGRKYTRGAQEQWVHKLHDNKTVLHWNQQGELESRSERMRHGISEHDIVLSRVGNHGISNIEKNTFAKGAIANNTETFHVPKSRHYQKSDADKNATNNRLSYSGNVQIQIGDGEFTAINWGTTNAGIKVGSGGFKSLAFGDNNVMVHLGEGDSKYSINIAGYQALEGAQLFIGNRNVSFNQGRSNDLIVMMDKSIPTPPLLNPFDGVSRVSGVLQQIAGEFSAPNWLSSQETQWTIGSVRKYLSDMSGLDQTSSVDYHSLTNLDSQSARSGRGLKSDLESTLNKQYNQWLSSNSSGLGRLSRADKFRQANEKLAFNVAVGGQGADIQATTGNWNFMFGDNIQSILDINLGSLFGLMTQQYTSSGLAKTTFTFSPADLPRQIKNKLLGRLATVNADTTLADIFGVDYTPQGQIISRSNQPVDGVAIVKEMLEVIGEFSGKQLQSLVDPQVLYDGIKANIAAGSDGLKSFLESHGLQEKAPAEDSLAEENNELPLAPEQAQSGRTFGFNSLNLPNLFATLFSQNKQEEMQQLASNLKQNLTDDLLHMQDKTFDFLRNSGHLQGDGDIHVSLGNYNFNWGGDGKDLGAYLGDNNNFWGGRGDDVFYSMGVSNIFTGGEGNDMGVMLGRENMMFGGKGNDVAVLAGRINYAYMGDGDDQVFAFGEGGVIEGGRGRDYIVAAGNFNRIDAGHDQDYVVAIGNNNQVDLGAGNDFANVFGNDNRVDGNRGNNAIKLMGYHALINGGTGNDHLIADVVSKFSQLNGGDGDDLLVLGGYQNRFSGGAGVNSYVVSGDVIDNVVEDIKQGDKIIFNNLNWKELWFQRSGYDLVLLTARNVYTDSEQGQFEAIGSVTFNDYFNGNRADIVTQMADKNAQGEREVTVLSANAVDSLVQAMSGFAPAMSGNGFIDSLDSKTQSSVMMAWSDTTMIRTEKSRLI
ncbi:MARTX multifunctional-autoprocessing repeats-in-toxin holotoxin RtxA [Xenorhabdus sp. 12]|uniref:MARTX multifunctional-autoprocessing repeats-in-toxin holotoxin RtxA n=1 Tax=Xenorhabdus santafensis TaxID=2582833 RepID=A0ABU4SAD7_9GAMM|nr:MARTX multifunctional-autoprocessing repeats-in-toxin holotoxin RtxA [Xenorhabdus sp. 12]MDX7987768.1 MARTX multifunctional-autoprocessing repeats-in-toxin holotoxin RtxA [Xenorhabdus sp. 12]